MALLPDLISYGIAGFVLWLFALAAFHKLTAPLQYSDLLPQYLPGLPPSRALVIAIGLVEAAVALAILVPALQAQALLLAALILLAYAGLMGWQLARGERLQRCGCAGPSSDVSVSTELVLRNIIVAALAILALLPSTPVVASTSGFALAAFVALLLIVLYLCAEQLLSNAQHMAKGRQ